MAVCSKFLCDRHGLGVRVVTVVAIVSIVQLVDGSLSVKVQAPSRSYHRQLVGVPKDDLLHVNTLWSIGRGGGDNGSRDEDYTDTDTIANAMFLESFQDEIEERRRDIQAETAGAFSQLRRDLLFKKAQQLNRKKALARAEKEAAAAQGVNEKITESPRGDPAFVGKRVRNQVKGKQPSYVQKHTVEDRSDNDAEFHLTRGEALESGERLAPGGGDTIESARREVELTKQHTLKDDTPKEVIQPEPESYSDPDATIEEDTFQDDFVVGGTDEDEEDVLERVQDTIKKDKSYIRQRRVNMFEEDHFYNESNNASYDDAMHDESTQAVVCTATEAELMSKSSSARARRRNKTKERKGSGKSESIIIDSKSEADKHSPSKNSVAKIRKKATQKNRNDERDSEPISTISGGVKSRVKNKITSRKKKLKQNIPTYSESKLLLNGKGTIGEVLLEEKPRKQFILVQMVKTMGLVFSMLLLCLATSITLRMLIKGQLG